METKKHISTAFWIAEAILVAAAAFFAFALIGYKTLALVCLGLALVVGVFHIIKVKLGERPGTAKRLYFALSFLLLLGVLAFLAFEIPVIKNAKTDQGGGVDWAIVLGAGVNGTEPSLSLVNRLDAALEFAEQNPQAKLVVSGGQGAGEDISEAQCMSQWLQGRGVAAERIIIEDRASSTEENLRFSQELIAQNGGEPMGRVAIITAEYHLYRAKLMAAQLGMDPLGVAARTTKPVLMVNYFIREAFALAAYSILT